MPPLLHAGMGRNCPALLPLPALDPRTSSPEAFRRTRRALVCHEGNEAMKPKFFSVAARLVALLSIAPQISHAGDDSLVGTLLRQAGVAIHVEALHAIEVIHTKGSFVNAGLSGSSDSWNEMGGTRQAYLFSTPPLGGGSGWDGKENWNLDQTGLVIVDGSVLGRSSAINSRRTTASRGRFASARCT